MKKKREHFSIDLRFLHVTVNLALLTWVSSSPLVFSLVSMKV